MDIKWTKKSEWGYKSWVYLADLGEGDWHFHIGKSYTWVLRGWGPNGRFAYREFTTLKAAKAEAATIVLDSAK